MLKEITGIVVAAGLLAGCASVSERLTGYGDPNDGLDGSSVTEAKATTNEAASQLAALGYEPEVPAYITIAPHGTYESTVLGEVVCNEETGLTSAIIYPEGWVTYDAAVLELLKTIDCRNGEFRSLGTDDPRYIEWKRSRPVLAFSPPMA